MEASAITTLLSSVGEGLSGSITAALPIAGPIMATVAGLFIGLKIFKRVTGAKTS